MVVIGKKYNKLTCIGKDESKDSRYYLFQCECGNTKSIIAYNVVSGRTGSCGCVNRAHPPHTKHGGRGTRLYNIWKSMRERCNNPNTNRHQAYHDKGVRVCNEWDDFSKFREWSLENGYANTLSIDRINTSGDYEPSNCRWVTMKEQQNNRTTNVHITINDVTKTLTQWSEATGIKAATLWNRYKRGDIGDRLIRPIENRGQ